MGTVTCEDGNGYDGYINSSGSWTTGENILSPGDGYTGYMGFSLDFDTQRTSETERGLALDPVIPTSLSITLTHTGFSGSEFWTGSIAASFVYYKHIAYSTVTSQNPWFGFTGYTSAAFLGWTPGNLRELSLATSSSVTLNSSNLTHTIEILPATERTENQDKLFGYMNNSNWDGILGVNLYINGTEIGGLTDGATFHGGSNINRPVFSYDEAKFNTGHDVGGVNRHARAIHCTRSGLPAMSDQLVEDGWTEGLYVLGDWWESDDRSQKFVNISDTEGSTDDIPGF